MGKRTFWNVFFIFWVETTFPIRSDVGENYPSLTKFFHLSCKQLHYQGLIEYVVEKLSDYDGQESGDDGNELVCVIPYGITGLVDKKTVLQCGEKVMNLTLRVQLNFSTSINHSKLFVNFVYLE